METETYNLYSLVISAITLLATVGGLYGIFSKIRKIREEAWSNMHSKLCDQSLELLRFLSESPNTYDYFYCRKPLVPDAPERITVLYNAEALANFLEHLILQQAQLPPQQWLVWKRLIHSTFHSSVVVCQFITENADWYSSDLVKIAQECGEEHQLSSIEAVSTVS